MEQWKPVVGFEGYYEVSNLGCVNSLPRTITECNGKKRKKTGKRLTPWLHKSGHLYVSLHKGERSKKQVHRLVMESFIGPCPIGQEVCHNNGVPDDNRLENLRYATRSENMKDAIVHTEWKCGENASSSKLKEADMPKIFKLRSEGKTTKAIGDFFGVRGTAISRILAGERWKVVNKRLGLID